MLKLPPGDLTIPNPWEVLLKKYKDKYGEFIKINNLGADAFRQRVEQTISDGEWKDIVGGDSRYSPFQVESLLAEGHAMLLSAEAERKAYEETSLLLFRLLQEIEEYLTLRVIHDREVANRFYELRYDKAAAMELAAQEVVNIYGESVRRLNKLVEEWVTGSRIVSYAAVLEAGPCIAGMPTHQDEFVTRSFNYSDWYYAGLNRFIDHGGLQRKHNVLEKIATYDDVNRMLANVFAANIFTQTDSAKAGLVRAVAEHKTQVLEKEWAYEDRGFRMQRTEAAREVMDRNIYEACRTNGLMNHHQRLGEIRKRFLGKLEIAVRMLRKARQGLRDLYAINNDNVFNVPITDADFPPRSKTVDWFERLIDWAIRSDADLDRFLRREQSYAKRFGITGDKLKSGLGKTTWLLNVGEETFLQGEARQVRVRGISAHVGGKAKGLWELRVSPPRGNVKVIIAGTPLKINKINQDNLPDICLGRVGTRDYPRPPDLVGVNALHNASPYGAWEVKLTGNSSHGEAPSADEIIDAIEIDIHVAFVSGTRD